MRRIIVIGSPGAGKSTFSRQLHNILGIPLFHLDKLYWKPGWVPTPDGEWEAKIAELVAADEWIIDGHYRRTLDLRLGRADAVIFLDMPRRVCLWQVFKRRIIYHRRIRQDINDQCPEKLDFEFFKWVWEFNKKQRPEAIQKLESLAAQKRVFILKSSSDTKRFLMEIQKGN